MVFDRKQVNRSLAAGSLEQPQELPRIAGPSRGYVRDSFLGFIEQHKMDARSLQPVIVIQPVGIDQGDVALAVAGDDFSASAFTCSASSERFARAWGNGMMSFAMICPYIRNQG